MQRIPLGAGLGPHAVRRRRGRDLGMVGPLAATVVGVAAAVAGVVLARAQPEVSVRFDATGYWIGGQDLVASGGGVYQSPSGAAVVIERQGSTLLAAASAELDGRPMDGRCQERLGSGVERCSFTLGAAHLLARDRWTGVGWKRRYADGQEVTIRVSGMDGTPVPFAVGLGGGPG